MRSHLSDSVIFLFGWGLRSCEPQSWKGGGRTRSGMVPFEGALMSSYNFMLSIVSPYLLLYIYAFQRYCHFSPPTSSIPKISPCSPRNRWMAFGLRRTRCWANYPCN